MVCNISSNFFVHLEKLHARYSKAGESDNPPCALESLPPSNYSIECKIRLKKKKRKKEQRGKKSRSNSGYSRPAFVLGLAFALVP